MGSWRRAFAPAALARSGQALEALAASALAGGRPEMPDTFGNGPAFGGRDPFQVGMQTAPRRPIFGVASRTRRRAQCLDRPLAPPRAPTPVPYYIRVLTPSEQVVPAGALAAELKSANLCVEAGSDAQWEELLLSHRDGRAIALIERNPVRDDSLGAEELEEFVDTLDDLQPAAAADWLRAWLPGVKTIYAFQILNAADQDNGWDAIQSLQGQLWRTLGGIFQADSEGFSNEAGYQIVWQFADQASGPWAMGVLQDGAWVHFEMELSDRGQREQFLRGEVPTGAKLVT
jgi:hypothetical protein